MCITQNVDNPQNDVEKYRIYAILLGEMCIYELEIYILIYSQYRKMYREMCLRHNYGP